MRYNSYTCRNITIEIQVMMTSFSMKGTKFSIKGIYHDFTYKLFLSVYIAMACKYNEYVNNYNRAITLLYKMEAIKAPRTLFYFYLLDHAQPS